jgi:hypothetical protein
MSFFKELLLFLKYRKKFWLYPILIAIFLLGALLVFLGQNAAVAPFIYSIF